MLKKKLIKMRMWICKNKNCNDSCVLIVKHKEVKFDVDNYTPKKCPFKGVVKNPNWKKLGV